MENDQKTSSAYKDYVNFIQANLKKTPGTRTNAKLTEINDLDSFDENIALLLKSFYDDSDTIIVRMATVLNSIYTQQNNVFLISVRLNNDLTKLDKNNPFESCNSDTHREIMNRFLTTGIFKVLKKSVRRSPGVKGKAGLYELAHPKFYGPLVQLMGQDMCKAKKDAFVQWWDDTESDEEESSILELPKPKMPKTELELELERRASERRKNRK